MRRKPGSLPRSLQRRVLALEELDCGRNKGKSMLQATEASELALAAMPGGGPGSLTAAFHWFLLSVAFRAAGGCTGEDNILYFLTTKH